MGNLYDKFMSELVQVGRRSDTIATVYLQLFSIQAKEALIDNLEYLYMLATGRDEYFKEAGKTEWFTIFHKSIRQGDFYTECFRKNKVELLTKEQRSEYKFLRSKVYEKGYKKEGTDGELFTPEYSRFLELNSIAIRENRDESINGKLDSILWNLIHLDTNNVLYNIFVTVFNLK